jgi:hypothetical protein
MAVIRAQQLNRNGISTPSSAATAVTKSTGRDTIGFLIQRRATSVAANEHIIQCAVDPDDKVAFVVSFRATQVANSRLILSAGQSREAFQAGTSKTFTISTTGALARQYYIGPFESAKYIRRDSTAIGLGNPYIQLTINTSSSGNSTRLRGTARVVAFKMPVVTYAT